MDSTRRALQIDGIFFFKFRIDFFQFRCNFLKEYWRINIDQIAICCISMDSTRRALQIDVKFFFQISD